jgi:adenylosuccinate synthase
LKICTAYELDGRRLDEFPCDAFLLEKCRPVYETLPGWSADQGADLGAARKPADLPPAARRYLDRLSELLGLPITIVSVGPDRAQTILMK